MAAAVAAIALAGRYRRLVLTSAILSAPYGLFSFVFVPAYWQPARVFEGFTGIEDLAFSFANGATAMSMALLFWPEPPGPATRPAKCLLRWVMWTLLGMAVGRALAFAGMPNMNTIWVAIMTVGSAILYLHPRFWRLALVSAPAFTLFYGFCLWLSYQLFPHFAEQWQPWVRQGVLLAGLPAEEIVWALGFGACWPLIMAQAAGLEPARVRG